MDENLIPTDVRARLFGALEPLTRGVVATHGQDVFEGLRLYVRPFPLPGESPGVRVFVVMVRDDDDVDAGRELTRGLVADMLNRAAVEAAVEDVLAVALSSLGEDAAADAVTAAQLNRAVLMVMARPATGAVHVVSVPKVGKPLVLGALVDEPLTVH